MGNTIGVAMGSTLVNNAVSSSSGLSTSLVQEILEKPALLASDELELDEETIQIVKNAYVTGFQQIFLAASICSAISFVAAAILIRHIDIDRGEEHQQKEKEDQSVEVEQ